MNDPPAPSKPAIRPLVALCWLAALALAGCAVARLAAHDATMVLIWVNSFTLYFYLPVYPVLVAALCRRRWRLAGASAAVAGCHLAWVLPDFAPAAKLPDHLDRGVSLRIVSANLFAGNPSRERLAKELLDADADVLLLQEYSPSWVKVLQSAGLFEKYPHRVFKVRADAFGIALFSKWPLSDAEIWRVSDLPMARATVHVGDARLRVVNVHPLPPRSPQYVRVWNEQLAALAEELAEETGPVVAVGDYNATQHSAWHRRLTSGRMRSAHLDRGRGWAITWPNGQMRLPPIRIDHALLSPEVACREIAEGEGAGSDHQPLVVDLVILPAEDTGR